MGHRSRTSGPGLLKQAALAAALSAMADDADKDKPKDTAKDKDKDAFYETISSVDDGVDDITIPWHARYILVMPGEFLQIVSRNEVSAAVHRVVAGGPPRLSAPILLRGRPGMALDVPKYLGEVNNELLE